MKLRIAASTGLLLSTLVSCADVGETSQRATAVELEPAEVTSTVTYTTRPSQSGSFTDPILYKTTFDQLLGTYPVIDGYCTDTVVATWAGVTSRGTCGGPGGGFASRTRVQFVVPRSLAGRWQIQIRPDYGLGGVVFLDGEVVAYNPNDMWEGLGQILQATDIPIAEGPHVLEAYGVENCCDGANFGLYMTPGGQWQYFGTTPEPPCPTEGYAKSCTPQCRALVSAANGISDRASGGERHFDRNEYLTLFAAVECRTGVPASVLKTIATSEGLGTYYEDPYPRQFLEPCAQSWTLGGWGYPELFSRYYGRQWPVLALDAPTGYQCGTDGSSSCSCPPDRDVTYDRPPPPDPAADRPAECTTSPPTDHQWATVWPQIVHVMLNDDRGDGTDEGNPSFGLGIMQTTFDISDIVQPVSTARATWVGTCYPALARGIYPTGGHPPSQPNGTVPLEPLPDLSLVVRDPQFNILLAAELILYKAQFAEGGKVRGDADQVARKLRSDRYGLTLAAGDHAPQTLTGTNSWSFQGAQYKTTNSCKTTACVQTYIEGVLNFKPNDARDAGCFAASPGRTTRNATNHACLYPVAHRFAMEPPQ